MNRTHGDEHLPVVLVVDDHEDTRHMSLFGRLRLDIKREHVEIKMEEREVEREENGEDVARPTLTQTAPAPRLAAAARPPARPANRA